MSRQIFQGTDRETLGRVVRAAWIQWAVETKQGKTDWLIPWEEMQEQHREADRQIGMAVYVHLINQAVQNPVIGDRVADIEHDGKIGTLTEGPVSWSEHRLGGEAPGSTARTYARVSWESGLLEWVPYMLLVKVQDE